MDVNYHSRKFLLSVLLILISSLFVGLDLIGADDWATFNTWLMGLYCGANVSTKYLVKPSTPLANNQVANAEEPEEPVVV